MKGPSLWTQGLERGADSDVQPSTNGRPHVRLRSPEKAEPARPTITRRLARPLPLVGVALVLAAMAGYWSVYSATTARTPVIAAAHDLQAGRSFALLISAWPSLRATRRRWRLWSRERARDGSGTRARRPGVAGSAAPRAAVAERSSGPAAFTLVVPALRALGGSLRPGDRVTVLATFESGAGARARAVARGLRVLEVGPDAGGVRLGLSEHPVTVALRDPSAAAALALANSEGKIDLLREGAKGRTAPIPPASAQGGS